MSLVSVPVQAYVGSSGEQPAIRLNQLHKECHSRIRYVKTCPIHGEVAQDQIVSGYEFAKGQYVEIEPQELAELRPERDRSINVDAFVKQDAVDPGFLTGKMYYLVPDGQAGQKPYQLICMAMEEEGLHAIARMTITTREHIVRVRPHDGLLTVDLLEYAAQVKDPAEFKQELVETRASAAEQKLTRQLIASMLEPKLDLSQYADNYGERVRELINAKVEGKELVTAAPVEEPKIVNLMDALRESMKRGPKQPKAAKSRGQVAPSVARRTSRKSSEVKAPERRRKSG